MVGGRQHHRRPRLARRCDGRDANLYSRTRGAVARVLDPTTTRRPRWSPSSSQTSSRALADLKGYTFNNKTDISAVDAASITHDVLDPTVCALAHNCDNITDPVVLDA